MLTIRDYKRIVDLIGIIHETCDPAIMFQELCGQLNRVVPFQSAAYAPSGEQQTGLQFPGALMYNLQPRPLYLFAQYYASHQPYLIAVAQEGERKYLNKATNLTEVISSRQLKDSEYGTDFQPMAGVFYESCTILGAQGDSAGVMGLHRPRGDRDFTAREQHILNHILPHFAHSLHFRGLTQGRFPSSDNGELVLDEDGRPLSMNEEAQRILQGVPLASLPVSQGDGRPTFFSTARGTYRLRRLSHYPKTKQCTVYLSPWPPRHVLDVKLSTFPLTTRQQEIARLVIRGYANRDIAEQLFVCEQTVKDHLHDIFRQLHIRRRTELVSRVLGLNMRPTGRSFVS